MPPPPTISWIPLLLQSATLYYLPFPGILGNDSLWFSFSKNGNGFFLSLPVPEFWECFFYSLSVPEFWGWIFSFLSWSRTSGLELSIPIPALELQKVIPAHPCWWGGARLDFELTRLYPSRAKTAFFVSIMLLSVVSVPQNHLKPSNKTKSLLHKEKDNRLEKMQVRGFKGAPIVSMQAFKDYP